jgi:hypothetical protein
MVNPLRPRVLVWRDVSTMPDHLERFIAEHESNSYPCGHDAEFDCYKLLVHVVNHTVDRERRRE